MHGHRDFCESRFAACRDLCLLLGEDRQILCRQAEDGKTERNEHRGDHHFRPLRGIARARAFDSGNGDVQTVGLALTSGYCELPLLCGSTHARLQPSLRTTQLWDLDLSRAVMWVTR